MGFVKKFCSVSIFMLSNNNIQHFIHYIDNVGIRYSYSVLNISVIIILIANTLCVCFLVAYSLFRFRYDRLIYEYVCARLNLLASVAQTRAHGLRELARFFASQLNFSVAIQWIYVPFYLLYNDLVFDNG